MRWPDGDLAGRLAGQREYSHARLLDAVRDRQPTAPRRSRRRSGSTPRLPDYQPKQLALDPGVAFAINGDSAYDGFDDSYALVPNAVAKHGSVMSDARARPLAFVRPDLRGQFRRLRTAAAMVSPSFSTTPRRGMPRWAGRRRIGGGRHRQRPRHRLRNSADPVAMPPNDHRHRHRRGRFLGGQTSATSRTAPGTPFTSGGTAPPSPIPSTASPSRRSPRISQPPISAVRSSPISVSRGGTGARRRRTREGPHRQAGRHAGGRRLAACRPRRPAATAELHRQRQCHL